MYLLRLALRGVLYTSIIWSVATSRVHAADSSDQFLAKLYTEGLGRAPDVSAWENFQSTKASEGCGNAIQNTAQRVIESTEFNKDYGNDYNAVVFAVYRALLNGDPNQSDFNQYVSFLYNGGSLSTFVVNLLSGAAFQNLLGTICATPLAGQSGSYGWTSAAAYFARSNGETLSAAQLNQLLKAASQSSNKVVALPPQSIVLAEAQINIPAGVTLMTAGGPGVTSYAEMARIVRRYVSSSAGAGDSELITVNDGSQLENIWIDGARADFLQAGTLDQCNSQGTLGCVNVAVRNQGSSTSTVTEVKITDSSGWTNLVAYGLNNGYVCAPANGYGAVITHNLDTQYATSHYQSSNSQYKAANSWSDGLSIECPLAEVENNDVVDPTDVGIVLFGNYAEPNEPQASTIAYNNIIAAGNAAFALTGADPHGSSSSSNITFNGTCSSDGAPLSGYMVPFDSSQISYNNIWTSTSSYVDFGIYLGVQGFNTYTNTGRNITVTGNQSGGIPLIASIGISISGMCNATLSNNQISFAVASHGSCPVGQQLAVYSHSGSPSVTPNTSAIPGCLPVDHR